MRSVSYRLADLNRVTVPLGFRGENEHTRVIIDCKKAFDEYPRAIPSLAVKNPDGTAYPAVIVREGDMVYWDVLDSDLVKEGRGTAQLTFTEDGVVRKDDIFSTVIGKSILPAGPAPDPVADWITEANKALVDVKHAIEVAEHAPVIDDNGYWAVWDSDAEEYVATEYKAQGEDGDPTVLIDDTAGSGATGKTWSADKIASEITDLNFYNNNASANFEDLNYLCSVQSNAEDSNKSHYKIAVPAGTANKYLGVGIRGDVLYTRFTSARFFKLVYTYATNFDDSLLKLNVYKSNDTQCYAQKTAVGEITAIIKFPQSVTVNTYALPCVQIMTAPASGYIEITSCNVEDITGTNSFEQLNVLTNAAVGKTVEDITNNCILGDTFSGTEAATRTGDRITFNGETFTGQKYFAVVINNASYISEARGKKLLFDIGFDISGDVKNLLVPYIVNNGNDIITIEAVLFKDGHLKILADIPASGTMTYMLFGVKNQSEVTVLNGPKNGDYIEITGYSVYALSVPHEEEDTTELRIKDAYLRMKEPVFFAESLTGLSVDTETKTVTASQTVTASNIYVGYRYNDGIAMYNEAIMEIKFSVTTTGSTAWALYASGNSAGKFERLYANYENGVVTLRYRIIDAKQVSFFYFYMKTPTFNAGDTITIGDVVVRDISIRNAIDRRYVNGVLTCFGDSYTMMQRWQYLVCNELFMQPFTEAFGQSGGTLTSIYSQISVVNTDADVLTVWIGTNDYAGNRSVGDINDTVNDTVGGYPTFCGALNYICDWISKNMKGKTVVFITPTFRYNSTDETLELANGTNEKGYVLNNAGYTLEDFANGMIGVANKWGYPVLDLFHNSGININSYTAYYDSDRLHPSWAGAKILAHKIAQFIKQQ